MKDRYISFETSQLAKEKGFNIEVCRCGGFPECICYNEAPTQSLLQKWLREEHKLSIEVYYFKGWDYDICFMETNTNTPGEVDLQTYEEALEAGLLEALKLI